MIKRENIKDFASAVSKNNSANINNNSNSAVAEDLNVDLHENSFTPSPSKGSPRGGTKSVS